MSKVWIVLVEDHHIDADALPYSTEEAAVAAARAIAARYAGYPEDIEENDLTEDMRRDGWVLYVSYSVEGDQVRVILRKMDPE